MTDLQPVFDPFEAGYLEDPYRQFAELRRHDPVHPTPFGAVFVSRYADVFALLRDPAMSVDASNATPGPLEELAREVLGEDEEANQRRGLSMLDRDPPDHTRLRKLVSRAFTPAASPSCAPASRSWWTPDSMPPRSTGASRPWAISPSPCPSM